MLFAVCMAESNFSGRLIFRVIYGSVFLARWYYLNYSACIKISKVHNSDLEIVCSGSLSLIC